MSIETGDFNYKKRNVEISIAVDAKNEKHCSPICHYFKDVTTISDYPRLSFFCNLDGTNLIPDTSTDDASGKIKYLRSYKCIASEIDDAHKNVNLQYRLDYVLKVLRRVREDEGICRKCFDALRFAQELGETGSIITTNQFEHALYEQIKKHIDGKH